MPILRPLPALSRPTRRGVLRAGLGAAALATMGRPARASVSPSDRKFIFVLAAGGWDPTRVMADGFDHAIVDAEADAERATVGGLTFVDRYSRPSVRSFFERYAAQTAFVQGMQVPSIAHEACFVLSLTGSSADTGSDWPSILGGAARDRYVAPTLVLGGPNFPGVNLPAVVTAGGKGQLNDLVDGGYAEWGTRVGASLSLPARERLDAHVRGRGRGFLADARSARKQALAQAFVTGAEQADGLEAARHQFQYSDVTELGDGFQLAVDALSFGLSRCVMVCDPQSGERKWDSHTTNDDLQDYLFEELFSNLLSLLFLLETAPGEKADTLLEETTIVLYSEMGRTPWLNAAAGKDHWPYTSAMLVGSGIRGGQSVGAWDESWYGESVDPETGEVDDNGVPVTCTALGATLLALGDVDPAEHTGSVEAIPALMA